MQNGYEVLSMAGIAAATGVADDGPGIYADTIEVGYSLGVGLQAALENASVRYKLTYDKLLEVISLRVAYVF